MTLSLHINHRNIWVNVCFRYNRVIPIRLGTRQSRAYMFHYPYTDMSKSIMFAFYNVRLILSRGVKIQGICSISILKFHVSKFSITRGMCRPLIVNLIKLSIFTVFSNNTYSSFLQAYSVQDIKGFLK